MSDKIERIIDALRKKILEEAIRGNLVPQNPEDEPASVLLQRIEAERERLIKEKKIKRPKSVSKIFRRDGHFYESINGGEPTCIDDDIPFDIPDSWEWCRLTSVCSFLSRGKSPKYSETEKKYPVFAQKCNLKEGGISLEKARFLDPKTIEKWQEVYKLQSGDILINSTGTGTVCRTRVFNESCLGHYPFTVPDSHVTVVRTFNAINSFFIFSYIEAVETQKYLEENLTGSTNQKELYIGVLENLLIPVPPAKEQGNIVNEIAALCKKLETISVSRRYYKRIRSETPTSLRQQLIQAAIQGQLVPQNPNDEPATILLERIAQERIAKQGKKAAKSMCRIERRGSKTYEIFPDGSEKDISGEIPFNIPLSWEWSRLGHICINRDSERVPLSCTQREKQQKLYDYYGASGVIDKVESYLFDSKLLLIGEDGANLINRSTDIAFFAEGKYWVNNHAHVLDSFEAMPLDFLRLYINSISLAPFVTGTAQPKLNQERLNAILVPVPPCCEQQRIVDLVLIYMRLIAL